MKKLLILIVFSLAFSNVGCDYQPLPQSSYTDLCTFCEDATTTNSPIVNWHVNVFTVAPLQPVNKVIFEYFKYDHAAQKFVFLDKAEFNNVYQGKKLTDIAPCSTDLEVFITITYKQACGPDGSGTEIYRTIEHLPVGFGIGDPDCDVDIVDLSSPTAAYWEGCE